ncbi:hypothetical protein PSTG_18418, partial [Puccinia striiformis f. sp. tritici PST-78]
INGDGKFYSNDSIVVTYDCDKTELLSDVFKNLNLGTIKTNGLSKPNIEEIKTAISKSNPNVKLDGIKFSEDTDYELKSQLFILNHELHTDNIKIINKTTNYAFVIGDGIFYNQDKIKITYQIQTIDIRTIIVDGPSIGNFSTSGQKPTVEAVYSRIQEKYSNLEMDRLKIDVISNKEATITGITGDDVIPLYT